jgi:hypothetical protein
MAAVVLAVLSVVADNGRPLVQVGEQRFAVSTARNVALTLEATGLKSNIALAERVAAAAAHAEARKPPAAPEAPAAPAPKPTLQELQAMATAQRAEMSLPSVPREVFAAMTPEQRNALYKARAAAKAQRDAAAA